MKKILLSFTILFLCHNLHAYSLREHVLSADVVVDGEFVLADGGPAASSYDSGLIHKLIVRKYLKGSGTDTLDIMLRGTFLILLRIEDHTFHYEMVYTLMEMRNNVYLANSELNVNVAPYVAEILALPEVDRGLSLP